jgi:hypothetical protein
MGEVHQFGIAVLVQPVLLEVATVAVLARDGAVAEDDLAMALIAAEVFLVGNRVVEANLVGTQVLPDVAVRAAGDVRVVLAGLEMADETGAFRDGDMVPLNDLGVAAGAAECLSSPQVSQVDFVIEDDPLELDLALEKPFVMAARPETAFVRDFSPRLGLDVELRPVAEDLVEAFELDAQERPDPGRIMALAALDAGMGGLLPALVEGFHIVADGAELVMGCVLGRAGKKQENNEKYARDEKQSLPSGLLLRLCFHRGRVG